MYRNALKPSVYSQFISGFRTPSHACLGATSFSVRHSSWFSKLIYPFSSPGQSITESYKPSSVNGNQCFLPIRSDNELEDTLRANNRNPLIFNFTVRGDAKCNELTGALNRIVLLETDKKVNIADVETDYLEVRDSMLRYGVKHVPTLIAVRKTFLVDSYVGDKGKPVNWLDLKKWIEKNAD
ncbi:LADA_0H15170g1_1 [Lachancea dasiensis]|uniref:LADA_0H15170g1_1 n=1 Tax=Lachancea dasiensis TaxID=1072105 RepID=A0A1G4K4R9_9SACH|nr:LADA_0H15170g1_1 [Lachancea dasiensis]